MNYAIAALTLIRGLVRPVAVLTIIGAVVGFLASGQPEAAKFTAAFGGPVIGWWFLERKQRHDDGTP